MNFKKMKGMLKLLHLGIAGIICLASCVAESEITEETVPDGKNVRLGISTRSFGNGTDEQVNTIRIIQVTRTIAQSVKSNRFINNPADPLQVEGLTGNYDIYVIVNESDDGSRLAALEHVGNLSELKKVILPYDIARRPQTNIPMLGEVENVTIGLPNNGKPSSTNLGTVMVGGVNHGTTLPVTLTRLAVCIDLTVKSKSFSALKSVDFTGLPNAIPLFGDGTETIAHDQKVTFNKDVFEEIIPSAGYISEKKKDAIILPSYLFLPTTDKSQAASVEVSLDGKPVSFKAKIGHAALLPSDSDKDYTLHPNTYYTLTALVAGDGLTIEAQVRNWDKNETNYPAGGGSFWKAQPKDTRVALGESATIYAEFGENGTGSTFKWFRKKQLADFTFSIEEITSGITNIPYPDYYRTELVLLGEELNDACEVYCIASITAPDGHQDRLESDYATFMTMGDEVKPAGTYPSMQNWKAPQNVPLGSTCLLQDDRDDKVYRVKLMADDNWWMIQDLAYGEASTTAVFEASCTNRESTNLIGTGLYGVCMKPESRKATSGYLYNRYAAIQLPQGTTEDHQNRVALNTEFIQGLCPQGWHLPGNINGTANKEWVNLQTVLKMDVTRPDGWMEFGYNNAVHFNGYNLIKTVDNSGNSVDAIAFHGGYESGNLDRKMTFCSLGFVTTDYENGAVTDIGYAIPETYAVPIRCVRNFKK